MHTYYFSYIRTIAHTYKWFAQTQPQDKTWTVSWRTKHSDLCKDSSFFSPQSAIFFSIFHSIWQGEKKKILHWKWNPGVAFHLVSRLNQRVTIWTMTLSGKHLLQVLPLHSPNNIFSFSEQLTACWKEETCGTIWWHKSSRSVCVRWRCWFWSHVE